MRFIGALVVVVVGAFLPALAAEPQHHHHATNELPVDKAASSSIFHLDAAFKDSAGRTQRLVRTRGKTFVVAMIYTSCPTVCPLTVEEMRAIEKKLSPRARETTRFLLVTFDPARDSPERLAEYARARKLAEPAWMLWTASAEGVRDFAAVLGMRYQAASNGDFAHSNLLTVWGPDGVIRHQVVGLGQDPAPTVKLIEGLR